MNDRRISPKQLEAAGWRRIDNKVLGKVASIYVHRDGWELSHCGHPTALWPYLLVDATGRVHLTGSRHGKLDHGTAWPTVRSAVDYVASVKPD